MFKQISGDVLLKYDRQTPRYTSYPTAPHFKELTSEIYQNWLKALPEKESLSLYFHIPFCDQICWYCGCYTKATRRYAPIEDYLHIMLREIKIVADLLKDKKQQVAHIHFGGGSPTILFKDDFSLLMQTIKDNFDVKKDAEIAIEVDPRKVSEADIENYAKQGVNRVSIGVQDFDKNVQKAINREQSFDLVYDVVKFFKKHQIKDINLDLIYGLPKQTIEVLKRNIDYSLLLQPSRIALFSYAHVNWVKKHMRLILEEDLPKAEEKITMYQEARKRLLEEGYKAIGLDHFSKDDNSMTKLQNNKKLKRNFQGYSSDQGEILIGFGASSISHLPNGYAQNTLDFNEYKNEILSDKLPIKKGIETSLDDKIRKKIIDEIMCYLEVDLDQICQEFSLEKNYFALELSNLEDLKKDALIEILENKIIINPSSPQITRIVASFFDKYLTQDGKKHSKIV